MKPAPADVTAGIDSDRAARRLRSGEPPSEANPIIDKVDAGQALDLLFEAVRRHGPGTVGVAHGGIVAAALNCGGLVDADLAILTQLEVRVLWAQGSLPCPMTLGAVAVFARAQRAQRSGACWGAALEHAARAAELLIGLLPLPPLVTYEEERR
jgi:hypothetical protein